MSIDRENSSLSAKSIYDFTPFTHLDYPNHLACIVWFSGCNMRCSYCYNKDIVLAKNGKYSPQDILDFLKKRVGLLDGVVLSGGEASMQDLLPFCKEIKSRGFKIKLDTNGTNPKLIESLLDLDLLDYIALDYKAPQAKFAKVTLSNKFDEFSQTLDLLLERNFPFEARTTLHLDLLDEEDINAIAYDLTSRGYKKPYFVQLFRDTGTNIGDIKESSKKLNEELFDKNLKIDLR